VGGHNDKQRQAKYARRTYNSSEALWLVFPLNADDVDGNSSYNYQAAHSCKHNRQNNKITTTNTSITFGYPNSAASPRMDGPLPTAAGF